MCGASGYTLLKKVSREMIDGQFQIMEPIWLVAKQYFPFTILQFFANAKVSLSFLWEVTMVGD